MSRLVINRVDLGTTVACALIAAGLIGAVVDNNGSTGLVLFIGGAVGLLYLAVRLIAAALRPHIGAPLPHLVRSRTIATMALVGVVLLGASNLFKSSNEQVAIRALNHVSFYGAVLLGLCLAGIIVATFVAWLRTAPADRS